MNKKNLSIRHYLTMIWAVFLIFMISSTAMAVSGTVDVVPDETVDGSVELTPGYISGTLDIGGQAISRIDLAADSLDYSAKIYPTAEGPYKMTVNVPKDGSLSYTVSGMAYMNSWNTRMYFKERSTTVSDGNTSTVNIIINSGYVEGKIQTNCAVSSGYVWAILDNGTGYTRAYTKFGSEGIFRLPVQPNSGIRVYGQVQFVGGAAVTLTDKYLNVMPGASTQVSWEANCTAGDQGSIQHDVDYKMPLYSNTSYLYKEGTQTPYKTTQHDGSSFFDYLSPGKWWLRTHSYWDNGKNLITKYMRDIDVLGGQTTYVAIDETPGFLQGKITLKGTKTSEDIISAYIYGYQKRDYSTADFYQSRSSIEPGTGIYNLALPGGEWDVYLSYYYFNDLNEDGTSARSNLYMYDYAQRKQPVIIESAQVITSHDLTYETGSATIKYTRSDGGTFTYPHIKATANNYAEDGSLDNYIYAYSYGAPNADRVTFTGFAGTFEVEAWANVDGSQTMFGSLSVEIVPGVEKVVDIGGPGLYVTSPEPDSVTSVNTVVVEGTATDDTGVDIILINGTEIWFESTNNPNDPNEVSFSIEIELDEGVNTIETIAMDVSGNSSSDKRSITYEIPVPEPTPEPETPEPTPEPETPEATPEPETPEAPTEPEELSMILDIKPGSCKNPFNVKSKGVLPVVILGSENVDTTQIDPDSLELMGIPLERWAYEDVATPITEDVQGNDDDACNNEEPDGYMDLILKFDTELLVKAIGEVTDQEVVTITLEGLLEDGTEFSASDIITILIKGNQDTKVKNNGKK